MFTSTIMESFSTNFDSDLIELQINGIKNPPSTKPVSNWKVQTINILDIDGLVEESN